MNCTMTAFEDYMAFLDRPVPRHAYYVYQLFDRMTSPRGELFGGLAPLMYKFMIAGMGLQIAVGHYYMMPKDYWYFVAPNSISKLIVLASDFGTTFADRKWVIGPGIWFSDKTWHAAFYDQTRDDAHDILTIKFYKGARQ